MLSRNEIMGIGRPKQSLRSACIAQSHAGKVVNQFELWIAVLGLTALLNVVPAFMPPTWALLAYFRVNHDLDVWSLSLVGALGATTGRALLALMSRSAGERIVPQRWQSNVTALVEAIRSRPSFSLPTLGLFALGPVPSNHLFIAAGLANAPLPPVLAVFAVARFVSYLIWVSAATTAAGSLRDLVGPRHGGGVGVAAQIAGFVMLILVMQIDWSRFLRRWTEPRAVSSANNSSHAR
jgi:membrane protein YqaA with SNARE-associated domain